MAVGGRVGGWVGGGSVCAMGEWVGGWVVAAVYVCEWWVGGWVVVVVGTVYVCLCACVSEWAGGDGVSVG